MNSSTIDDIQQRCCGRIATVRLEVKLRFMGLLVRETDSGFPLFLLRLENLLGNSSLDFTKFAKKRNWWLYIAALAAARAAS